MKLQIRKYKDEYGDIKYSMCALDSNNFCHINKPINEKEFDLAFEFYSDSPLMEIKDDHGQSEEIYEVLCP